MSNLGLAIKSEENCDVEIKNESSVQPEFDFNDHEHNYCINDYSTRAHKHFIYLNEKNIPQFETLENVEPSLVLLTYFSRKDDDVNKSTDVVNEVQSEDVNTVQIYNANGLVQDVFVPNGEVELVKEEESQDATVEDNQEETQHSEEDIVPENHLIHKVNGSEVWIMVEEGVEGGSENNVDESQTEDCVLGRGPFVYEESGEDEKTEWFLRKSKAKSKAARQRRALSKKSLPCKNKEIADLDGATKKVQKRSWVWKYFSNQGDVIYQCSLCRSNLSIKGCNTNNMNRHIRTKHFSIYNTEMETKQVAVSESENGEKNESEEIVVCNTYKPLSNNTEDDGSLFKQRWRSWVWLLFEQVSPTVARCKICNRKITHGGTATGNLNRHTKLLHKELYAEVCASENLNRRPSRSFS